MDCALLGLAMLRLFPRFVERFLDGLERDAAVSLGVGAVALVATGPLAIVLAITIVGPLAGLLGVTLGLGALVIALYRSWQREKMERRQPDRLDVGAA